MLADFLRVPQVSTGELLRAAVKQGTALGKEAKGYMDRGDLVPDKVILGLIREILDSKEAARGVMMDGFPRTVPQAQVVDKLLSENQGRVDRVILLDASEEELVQRLLGRAAKEGRSDDNLESIKQRLKVYHDQTAPLVAYYEQQKVVKRVPGMGSVDDIQKRVREAAKA